MPIASAPIGYGWLIELLSYSSVFAIGFGLGLLGLLMSLRIDDSRDDIVMEIIGDLAENI